MLDSNDCTRTMVLLIVPSFLWLVFFEKADCLPSLTSVEWLWYRQPRTLTMPTKSRLLLPFFFAPSATGAAGLYSNPSRRTRWAWQASPKAQVNLILDPSDSRVMTESPWSRPLSVKNWAASGKDEASTSRNR